ncbi:hypothetical protein [Pontitalea aquivivens]|uniref:hypothetical protein n=1 Tax=Pontitalea aquivivens TaxID=3388663 RepID=UPI00397073A4
MRSMKVSFLSILGYILVLGSANADAEERFPCVPGHSGDAGGIMLMDHSYPVRRELGSNRFDIPYGYLTVRPPPSRINCFPKRDSVSFAFWVPDLRAPKDDWLFQPDFRVQEPGRPRPDADEFVVKVSSVSPEDQWTPAIGFKNLIDSWEKPYRIELRHGLLHILPGENPQAFDTYADLSQENGQFLLACDRPESRVPNPLCRCDLYFSDLQLEAALRFPRDALPRWREIRDGVRTLLDRWAVQN